VRQSGVIGNPRCGTGAGGGTLLPKPAPGGKRILMLERGPFLPREKENWDTKIAFNTTRYFGPEDSNSMVQHRAPELVIVG
jgi:hypothetical protein